MHQKVEINLKCISPDFFHVIVLTFSVTVNGCKLLLTQSLLHMYSEFCGKKKKPKKKSQTSVSLPRVLLEMSFNRSCKGQSTAVKNRNFRKLELSL